MEVAEDVVDVAVVVVVVVEVAVVVVVVVEVAVVVVDVGKEGRAKVWLEGCFGQHMCCCPNQERNPLRSAHLHQRCMQKRQSIGSNLLRRACSGDGEWCGGDGKEEEEEEDCGQH